MTLQVPTTLVTLTSILPLSCSVDVPFINGKYSKDDSIRHYTFQNITPSSIHSDSSRHSPLFLLSLMQSQTRSSQSTQYTINVSSSFFQQTHHILHSLNSVSLLEGRYTTNWPLLKEPGLTTWHPLYSNRNCFSPQASTSYTSLQLRTPTREGRGNRRRKDASVCDRGRSACGKGARCPCRRILFTIYTSDHTSESTATDGSPVCAWRVFRASSSSSSSRNTQISCVK